MFSENWEFSEFFLGNWKTGLKSMSMLNCRKACAYI